ncbi:MAG: pyrimidine/purine nucleoside phosphorylase [Chloroflexi bacterium]|nr:pyrimidine/purine nucleoside phosphorylase [Chloroflexota bacterium]
MSVVNKIMPSKKYRLDIDGPKRLDVSWSKGFGVYYGSDFIIKLDEETIATFPTAKELRTGQVFHLPDDSSFEIKVKVDSDYPQVIRQGVQICAVSEAIDVLEENSKSHFSFGGVILFVFVLAVGYHLIKGGIGLEGLVTKLVMAFITGLAYLAVGYLIKRRSAFAAGLGIAISIAVFILISVESVTKALQESDDLFVLCCGDAWVWFATVSWVINLMVLEIRAIRALRALSKLLPKKS